MAVKVQFEIGHTAKLRSKKTPEGFTHDWELHVRGVNKADISTFVEKVVFNLHDSFPRPKRTCKDAPYLIQESGYAGFLLPIDIYFRNRDEPKRFQFTYDLDLQPSGPPHHRTEVQIFIFESPSDELRQKLLKGGGVPVSGVLSGPATVNLSGIGSAGPEEGMISKPKLSTSGESSKKHKSRSDDTKNNTFANVFGPPITKTKHSPENKSGNSVVKSAGSHTSTVFAATPGGPSVSKEKSSKDKDKGGGSFNISAGVEKIKDRKEKYNKVFSPHKESRVDGKKSTATTESNKHEKRSEEKSKKDKGRDKERERSREKVGGNMNASGMKRPLSPKANSKDAGACSPKRHGSPSVRGRLEEAKATAGRVEVDQKAKDSSLGKVKDPNFSSNKKSKKEKKDKDRDKEKRDENKEKHRTIEGKLKDERTVSGSHGNNTTNTHLSSAMDDGKDLKAPTASLNSSVKQKSEKLESKSIDAAKARPIDKANTKDPSKGSSTPLSNPMPITSGVEKKPVANSTTDKDKKSHKHKKKDKNKEKDREKDKYKEKSKDKDKEREKIEAEKPADKLAVPETKAKLPPTEPSKLDAAIGVNSNVAPPSMAVSSSGKKGQVKEKKTKDSKSNKSEEKRPSDLEPELKSSNKHGTKPATTSAATTKHALISSSTSSSTSSTTTNNNIDLSDADSLHSMPEALQSKGKTNSAATPILPAHSDSSNSSFPEILAKSSVASTKALQCAGMTGGKESSKSNVGGGDAKQRQTDKERGDKEKKIRGVKPERDDKKRRRNSTNINAINNNNNHSSGGGSNSTFIEPPLKQLKKDQSKSAREKSKSPSLRTTNGRTVSSDTNSTSSFLPPPANAPSSSITSSPASSAIVNATNTPLTTSLSHPQSPALATDAVSNAMTASSGASTTPSVTSSNTVSILPTDYLSELQELHHKIMTLQDNGELQHVVELIAATGCYEITSKTFDFDLCKLDRTTVQRLQDFFSTSVS